MINHDDISAAIKNLGLEKFLEMTGESCAQIGHEQGLLISDPAGRQLQQAWEHVGNDLRKAAATARHFRIGNTDLGRRS